MSCRLASSSCAEVLVRARLAPTSTSSAPIAPIPTKRLTLSCISITSSMKNRLLAHKHISRSRGASFACLDDRSSRQAGEERKEPSLAGIRRRCSEKTTAPALVGRLGPNLLQKLRTERRILLEAAEHGAGAHPRAALFDAAHGGA